jgi:hypothetical protein
MKMIATKEKLESYQRNRRYRISNSNFITKVCNKFAKNLDCHNSIIRHTGLRISQLKEKIKIEITQSKQQ